MFFFFFSTFFFDYFISIRLQVENLMIFIEKETKIYYNYIFF